VSYWQFGYDNARKLPRIVAAERRSGTSDQMPFPTEPSLYQNCLKTPPTEREQLPQPIEKAENTPAAFTHQHGCDHAEPTCRAANALQRVLSSIRFLLYQNRIKTPSIRMPRDTF